MLRTRFTTLIANSFGHDRFSLFETPQVSHLPWLVSMHPGGEMIATYGASDDEEYTTMLPPEAQVLVGVVVYTRSDVITRYSEGTLSFS